MGTVAGLLLGTGVLLVWSAWWPTSPPRSVSRLAHSWADLRAQAGLHGLGTGGFVTTSAGIAVTVSLVALGLGSAISVSIAFGLLAAAAPLLLLRARAGRRRRELRGLWPDVVDDLTSAVRAGLPLPEALAAMAERGPVELRADMAVFAAEYRATGRFAGALEVWQARLADPVADRLAATLRIAAEVGGSDLGRMLRTLSEFLRADLRTRGELQARQSWTVNGARLAVAAPWVVLAFMSGRGHGSAAFDTPLGVVVLVGGAAVSAIAYALMLRIGRLPEEPRVLRGTG